MKAYGLDEASFKRYWHNHQKEYTRKHLRSVLLYYQGVSCPAIGGKLGIKGQTVGKYVETYLSGGLKALYAKVKRPRQGALSVEQEPVFKQTLLSRRPFEVGLRGNIWTGELMEERILSAYGVTSVRASTTCLKGWGSPTKGRTPTTGTQPPWPKKSSWGSLGMWSSGRTSARRLCALTSSRCASAPVAITDGPKRTPGPST